MPTTLPTSLPESPKNRHAKRPWWRWFVAVFLGAVLLLLGWVYRPLNGTEQKLLGKWHLLVSAEDRAEAKKLDADVDGEVSMVLQANRQWEDRFEGAESADFSSGSWSASPAEIRIWPESPQFPNVWSQLKWRWRRIKTLKLKAFEPIRWEIQEFSDTKLVISDQGRVQTFERQK